MLERPEKIMVYGKMQDVKELAALKLGARKMLFRESLRHLSTTYLQEFGFKGKLKIWNMRKLGSYSPKTKTIVLSLYLSMLPRRLIRYVAFHEYVHTLEKSHNKRFWRIMEKLYPNYANYEKEIRRRWPRLLEVARLSGVFEGV